MPDERAERLARLRVAGAAGKRARKLAKSGKVGRRAFDALVATDPTFGGTQYLSKPGKAKHV